jgi:hypothetical protein
MRRDKESPKSDFGISMLSPNSTACPFDGLDLLRPYQQTGRWNGGRFPNLQFEPFILPTEACKETNGHNCYR